MSHAVLTLLLCALAAAQTGPAQEGAVPAKIGRFLKRCETSRAGAILQLEYTLRGLRNQEVPTREAKRRITSIEKQLGILRSNSKPVVPQISFPPQIGEIGRLPRLSGHVDQVVSNDEVLVRCQFPVVVTAVRRFQAHRETVVQGVQLLIRGLPTANIQEGSDLEMLQVFEIMGKETYQKVGGESSNVLVLQEFDMKAVEPYFQRMVEPQR